MDQPAWNKYGPPGKYLIHPFGGAAAQDQFAHQNKQGDCEQGEPRIRLPRPVALRLAENRFMETRLRHPIGAGRTPPVPRIPGRQRCGPGGYRLPALPPPNKRLARICC